MPQLTANLFRQQRTVLRLPLSYHPAISARLYRNAVPRKRIDVPGGAELLARIAEVDGLAELRRLVPAIDKAGARIRLRSPAPHLLFNVPAESRLAGSPQVCETTPEREAMSQPEMACDETQGE